MIWPRASAPDARSNPVGSLAAIGGEPTNKAPDRLLTFDFEKGNQHHDL